MDLHSFDVPWVGGGAGGIALGSWSSGSFRSAGARSRPRILSQPAFRQGVSSAGGGSAREHDPCSPTLSRARVGSCTRRPSSSRCSARLSDPGIIGHPASLIPFPLNNPDRFSASESGRSDGPLLRGGLAAACIPAFVRISSGRSGSSPARRDRGPSRCIGPRSS